MTRPSLQSLFALSGLLIVAACRTAGPAAPVDETRRPAAASGYLSAGRSGGYAPPAGYGRDDLVRIGLLLPFGAEDPTLRRVARAMERAAQLALFAAPDAGVVIIPKDTGGDAVQAAAAAEAALADGADILIGPLLAPAVRAAGDVARAQGAPVIGFSTDRGVGGDGVYLLSFQVEGDVAAAVDHAMREGRGAFAALAPDTPYGRRAVEVLAKEVFVRAGELVAAEFYVGGAEGALRAARTITNYDARAAALRRLRAEAEADPQSEAALEAENLKARDTYGPTPFDAVFVFEDGADIRAVSALLPFFDVDTREVQVLGASLWSDDDLTSEPALRGARYPAAPKGFAEQFRDRYARAYAEEPPEVAALAYDAVALAAILAGDDPRRPFRRSALEDPQGFSGVDGAFRFTAEGGAERLLAIWRVTRDGAVLQERAPTGFSDPEPDPRS